MALFGYVRDRRWVVVFGYILFIGMMATGYYYNLTFVQLGLVDLGTRLVKLSEGEVAIDMALLAIVTSVVALGFGLLMQRRDWSRRFVLKIRLAFAVVVAQAALTAIAPSIRDETGLLAVIAATSVALGVGVPATFSLAVDLVPVRDRGYVAAAITGGAYFFAAVFSSTWLIERFARQILWLMLAGAAGLGALAFIRLPFIQTLAAQHRLPEFAEGRLVRRDAEGRPRIGWRMGVALGLMFGVFFMDSLGFLRIIATPVYTADAWHSSEPGILLFIGLTHVMAAVIAGILYAALDERAVFLWMFGVFALAEFEYMLHARLPGDYAPLAMPMLYAIAVSMYTVVNFAIWADLSTPGTISRNAAFGVALSGFTASFASTALAFRWRATGVGVDEHFNRVAALALILFLVAIIVAAMHRPAASEGD